MLPERFPSLDHESVTWEQLKRKVLTRGQGKAGISGQNTDMELAPLRAAVSVEQNVAQEGMV